MGWGNFQAYPRWDLGGGGRGAVRVGCGHFQADQLRIQGGCGWWVGGGGRGVR